MFLDSVRNETFQTMEAVKRANSRLSLGGVRFSDLVKQIDKFYADTANLRVPVIEAYVYAIKKMKGSSPQQLAQDEASLRRTYNR